MKTNINNINTKELEFNKLISQSIEEKSKYYALKKRYQIIIGCFLMLLSFLLIGILVFFSKDLAIQQALVAITVILLVAALKSFQEVGNLSEDKEINSFDLPINLDKIIFDSRTIIEGSYKSYSSKNEVANYTTTQKQNLAEAASEIQKLLEQLSLTHPTQTAQEKITIAEELIDEIDNSPTLKQKVISAVKTGGISELRESISHPLASIALANIEEWQENDT